MRRVQIDRDGEEKVFFFPSSWNDVSSADAKKLASLIIEEKYNKTELLIRWAARLMEFGSCSWVNGKVLLWNDPQDLWRMDVEDMAVVSSLLEFVFQDDVFSPGLLYAPEIPGMHNPSPVMADITFEQYQMIMSQTEQIRRENMRADSLFSLAGILYRPAGRDWNADMVEWYAKSVSARMDDADRLCMVWYITGSMAMLANRYSRVFSGGDSEGQVDMLDVQLRMLDAISEGDVTKRAGIRASNLIDVLSSLEYKIERYEAQEQMIKNR